VRGLRLEWRSSSSDGSYGDGGEGAASRGGEKGPGQGFSSLLIALASHGRRGGGDGVAAGARLSSPLAGKLRLLAIQVGALAISFQGIFLGYRRAA
jgi:hypothetical protein